MNLLSTLGCAALIMLSGIGKHQIVHWYFSAKKISGKQYRVLGTATIEPGWSIRFFDSCGKRDIHDHKNRAAFSRIITTDETEWPNIHGYVAYTLSKEDCTTIEQTQYNIQIPKR